MMQRKWAASFRSTAPAVSRVRLYDEVLRGRILRLALLYGSLLAVLTTALVFSLLQRVKGRIEGRIKRIDECCLGEVWMIDQLTSDFIDYAGIPLYNHSITTLKPSWIIVAEVTLFTSSFELALRLLAICGMGYEALKPRLWSSSESRTEGTVKLDPTYTWTIYAIQELFIPCLGLAGGMFCAEVFRKVGEACGNTTGEHWGAFLFAYCYSSAIIWTLSGLYWYGFPGGLFQRMPWFNMALVFGMFAAPAFNLLSWQIYEEPDATCDYSCLPTNGGTFAWELSRQLYYNLTPGTWYDIGNNQC